MKTKWTISQIKSWYKKQGFITGCNFLPSNVVNRLDMWQSYKRDEHLLAADKELKMCHDLGFNSVRLWLNFDVYFKESKEFLITLEKYISLCAKHKQSVMLVLAYEEDLPYTKTFVPKELGEQKKYYNHFNRDYELLDKNLKEGNIKHYLEYPSIKNKYLEMVKKVVTKYRNDKRILAWNIFNEPGIEIDKRNIPLMKELHDLVRSLDPIQPLASDIYYSPYKGKFKLESEKVAAELSDFISYHNYQNFKSFKEGIEFVKQFNRPIIVTEWLNRCNHNNIEDIYPYLKKNTIGSYIWGFVAGDTFTTEPWDSIWKDFKKNPKLNFDVTKWQHEIYRKNGHPYNPKEIEIIKKYNNIKNK